MNGLIRTLLQYRIIVLVVFVVALLAGSYAYSKLDIEAYPDPSPPMVEIITQNPSWSAEEMEQQVTIPVENAIYGSPDLEEVRSISIFGLSDVKLYFSFDSDYFHDREAVLYHLQTLTLPDNLQPQLSPESPIGEIYRYILTGPGYTLNEIKATQVWLVTRELKQVPGIIDVATFGGTTRQYQVIVNPDELLAHKVTLTQVVNAIQNSNANAGGDYLTLGAQNVNVRSIGLLKNIEDIGSIVVAEQNNIPVLVRDVAIVRRGYQPPMGQVGRNDKDNVVEGIVLLRKGEQSLPALSALKKKVYSLNHGNLLPPGMQIKPYYDRTNLIHITTDTVEHIILTGLILVTLVLVVTIGDFRTTLLTTLTIPFSVLFAITLMVLTNHSANLISIGAIDFGILAHAAIIVLENIYRHLETGDVASRASETGTNEVATAVLAITLATCVVFFPVVLLSGVSKYLFTALAMGVIFSLVASYFVAVSVVPLYCSRLLKPLREEAGSSPEQAQVRSLGRRFHDAFNARFDRLLYVYDRWVMKTMDWPRATAIGFIGIFALSLLLYPLLGFSFFPRVDAGQFMINLKAPTGSRLAVTDDYVKQVENIIRRTVGPRDLQTIVSNIGLSPGFESLFSPNAAMYTAFVQVGLKTSHKVSSFTYMDEVQRRVAQQLPELRTYFHSGALVSSVLDQGVPAPIDLQVSGLDLNEDMKIANKLADQIRRLHSIKDVYIPQGMDYPSLQINMDRTRVSELGLTPKRVIDDVITALTSNQMIAPSYWISPQGNQYFVSVQYPDNTVRSVADLQTMPLHDPQLTDPTYLNQVATVKRLEEPTEVDHYQLEREVDIYVNPVGQDLSRPLKAIQNIVAHTPLPSTNFRVDIRGLVDTMKNSFHSFAMGLMLAILLVYLIMVAQFRSFLDPLLILLAIPTGLTGVLLILFITGTTINIQSLMGVLMMVGMVVSNTILIVDFAKRLQSEGRPVRDAIAHACRIRLRPILMTSLATVVGLIPMAMKLEPGAGAYSPLALSIIGGVTASVLLSIFVIPAAYVLVYDRHETIAQS